MFRKATTRTARVVFVVVAEGNIRHGDASWRPCPPEVIGGPYASEAQAQAIATAARKRNHINERVVVRSVAL